MFSGVRLDNKAQVIEAVSAAAVKTGSAAAMTGGVWAWLGANQSNIGAVCAMIGAAVAVVSLIVNLSARRCLTCEKRAAEDAGA